MLRLLPGNLFYQNATVTVNNTRGAVHKRIEAFSARNGLSKVGGGAEEGRAHALQVCMLDLCLSRMQL